MPPSPVRGVPLASLTPAPRRQDHTTSPYAQAAHVSRSSRVHRISPRVRDDGQRPSSAVRRASYVADLPDDGSGIFLQTGLDDPNQLDPSRKISTLAQRPERQLRAQDARLPSVSGLPHSVARLPTVKHARFRPLAQRFPLSRAGVSRQRRGVGYRHERAVRCDGRESCD